MMRQGGTAASSAPRGKNGRRRPKNCWRPDATHNSRLHVRGLVRFSCSCPRAQLSSRPTKVVCLLAQEAPPVDAAAAAAASAAVEARETMRAADWPPQRHAESDRLSAQLCSALTGSSKRARVAHWPTTSVAPAVRRRASGSSCTRKAGKQSRGSPRRCHASGVRRSSFRVAKARRRRRCRAP